MLPVNTRFKAKFSSTVSDRDLKFEISDNNSVQILIPPGNFKYIDPQW